MLASCTDQYSNPNTCNTVKLPDHACLMAGLKHWHSVQEAARRGCSPQTRAGVQELVADLIALHLLTVRLSNVCCIINGRVAKASGSKAANSSAGGG